MGRKESMWKRYLKFSGVLFGVIGILFVSPCWGQDKKNPIKVGWICSLSGAGGITGLPQLQAFQMAVKEINAAGGILGRRVEYVVRDDKSNAGVGAREARDLIDNEKVDFLEGMCNSAVALSVSAVAREKKKIVVIENSVASRITEEDGHRYLFRPLGNTRITSGFLADESAKLPGDRYVMLAGDYAWGRDSVRDFERVLTKVKPEAKILERLWPKFGQADYSGFMTRALALNPDVFACFLTGADCVTFIRQGLPYKVFEKTKVTAIYLDQNYVEALGQEMPEGMMTYSHFFYNTPGAKADEFRKKVKNETGLNPGGNFIMGYIPVFFLKAAIEKAKSTDTEKVIEAFEGISLDTVLGKVTVRACDHQGDFGDMIGWTKKTPQYEFSIVENIKIGDGNKYLPSCDEIKKVWKN
jgi:branched-chain amino acid transport system substrate-binding protein